MATLVEKPPIRPPQEEESAAHNALLRKREAREVWLLLALQPVFLVLGNVLLVNAMHYLSLFEGVKRLYAFNTLVIPCSLAVAGALALWCWRRAGRRQRWLFRAAGACLIGAFLGVGVRAYATYVEPRMLFVRQVDIVTAKVDRPLRILHISDIQSGRVGSYERRAFARMRALSPDLVLHTGDLSQPVPPAAWQTEAPKLAALFETLNPPLGKFGVYGDVDAYFHAKAGGDVGGLKILESQEAVVPLGGSQLRILGLSLPESALGDHEHVRQWLDEAGPKDFTIVMGHMPDYAMSLQDLPVDLCLAGHTHGGQVRIPLFGPLMTLSAVPRDWARGFRSIGATSLNVTGGVGSEHGDDVPPLRLFCPTEMTLIRLWPAPEGKNEQP